MNPIDRLRIERRRALDAYKQLHNQYDELQAATLEPGYTHWKGSALYIRRPRDPQGHRAYIHVGTDPAAQRRARRATERWQFAVRLDRRLRALADKIHRHDEAIQKAADQWEDLALEIADELETEGGD